MHSKIKEKSTKFEPIVVEITLPSREDLHAFSAIMNHPAITEDLDDENLFKLLHTKELTFLDGEEANEKAFDKLDKRMHHFNGDS